MSQPLTHIGKYQLVRKLAVGGMAEVYLAKVAGPVGFEKTLVLKRILPHLAEDSSFVDMFFTEAQLSARLNHPNVVQVFEFGESDGSYYMVMEYIDGPSLRTLLRKGLEKNQSIPFNLAAKIISFACEGLSYAHDLTNPDTGEALNIVHRDVSPDNVLISKSGSVKVVDFGIAKAAVQNHHTRTGTIKGKFSYMPPEQLRGQPIDRRVDIFALGIVLHELLTGTKPFDANSDASIVQAILYEPMRPVWQSRPDAPEALQQIIDRALAKDKDKRYSSCHDMQVELERFIAAYGEPVNQFRLAQLVHSLIDPSPSGSFAVVPDFRPSGPAGQVPRSSAQPPQRISIPHQVVIPPQRAAVPSVPPLPQPSGPMEFPTTPYDGGQATALKAEAERVGFSGTGPRELPTDPGEEITGRNGGAPERPAPSKSSFLFSGKATPLSQVSEDLRVGAGQGERRTLESSRADHKASTPSAPAYQPKARRPVSMSMDEVSGISESSNVSAIRAGHRSKVWRVWAALGVLAAGMLGIWALKPQATQLPEVAVDAGKALLPAQRKPPVDAGLAAPVADAGGAKQQFSKVEFRIRPFATVYVDGKRLGDTPLQHLLPVGRHQARFVFEEAGKSAKEHQVSFEVTAEGPNLITHKFE